MRLSDVRQKRDPIHLYNQAKAVMMEIERAEGYSPCVVNRDESYLLSIIRDKNIDPVELAKQIKAGQVDVNSLI